MIFLNDKEYRRESEENWSINFTFYEIFNFNTSDFQKLLN